MPENATKPQNCTGTFLGVAIYVLFVKKVLNTLTAGLANPAKNRRNPSHKLRRRLCKDSTEPEPQPSPKTLHRLGRTQEHKPSRRLSEDSNICMVPRFMSSILPRTLEEWRAGGEAKFNQTASSASPSPPCVCPAWARCKWGSSPL